MFVLKGVNFKGLAIGCQKETQTPCWLRLWYQVLVLIPIKSCWSVDIRSSIASSIDCIINNSGVRPMDINQTEA